MTNIRLSPSGRRRAGRLAAAVLTWTASTAAAADAPRLDIPHRRFDLENGLVVLLHEDHPLPQVTVNLTYRLGSIRGG